jgi:transposase-like protein
MSQIRWDELSEARQLARLAKSLSRTAQTRLQWMLFYFFNGRNAARTCRHFGVSRQTFYRWRRRFDRHGSITSYAAGSTPTIASARTSRSLTSRRWNLSPVGKNNRRKAKCH